jgi:hypothetical protein
MILVPEIETIVILVPRTGSGSLRRAIAHTYPKSILLYRHMEADGVPAGYDRWRKIGVVREPIDRLWSLYKFLREFGGSHDPAYIAAMRESVSCSFDTWIRCNQIPFTTPYDAAGRGRFFPLYTVRHPLPENQKSQFMYLRPDLGTCIYRYDEIGVMAAALGIGLGQENATPKQEALPDLSQSTIAYVDRVFAWDKKASR